MTDEGAALYAPSPFTSRRSRAVPDRLSADSDAHLFSRTGQLYPVLRTPLSGNSKPARCGRLKT